MSAPVIAPELVQLVAERLEAAGIGEGEAFVVRAQWPATDAAPGAWDESEFSRAADAAAWLKTEPDDLLVEPVGGRRQADDTRLAPTIEEALSAAGYADGEAFELAAIWKRAKRGPAPAAQRFARTAEGIQAAAAWAGELSARLAADRARGQVDEGGVYLSSSPLRSLRGGRPSDRDAATVRVLLIDPDPDSNSPEDRAVAAALAEEIRALLEARLGVRPPLVDSGRGRHLWLQQEPVSPDDQEAKELRRRVLEVLAARFDRPGAKVDRTTHNATRLMRLPGTANLRTGDRARLLDAGNWKRAPLAALERLVEELERERGAQADDPPVPPPVAVAAAAGDPDDGPRLPPFPLDVFPPRLRATVGSFARAVEAPVELAAMPALCVAGAAFGPRWRCGPPGIVRPPLVWGAAAAVSGSGKSPAAAPCLAPLERIDVRLREEAEFAARAAEAQEGGKGKGKRKEQEKPGRRRVLVTDTTPEALVAELQRAEGNGVLLHSDELATMIGGMDGYKPSGGRWGRSMWLSLWNGAPVRLVRKVAQGAEVDRPFCAVFGGVQPSILAKLELSDADGLCARFLWSHVPVQPHGLGRGVPPEAAAVWQAAVELAAGHQVADEQPLEPDAEALLDELSWRWTAQAGELDRAGLGLQSSFYGKALDYLARLTSLLHGLDAIEASLAENPQMPPALEGRPVPRSTVERALRLVDYFLAHGLETARLVTRKREPEPEEDLARADAQLADALRELVAPGTRVQDSASGWARRLARAGLEAFGGDRKGMRAGKALARLSVTPLRALVVEQLPRGEGRGWAVEHRRAAGAAAPGGRGAA